MLVVGVATAQWLPGGNAVCDTSINGVIDPLPKIASDEEGGAYICWRDVRDSLGGYGIYAQHVDSTGKMLWRVNGIPIVQANNNQEFQRITPDGKGGAYIAWEDSRIQNTFVYVQRVDKQGNCLWQANGIKAAETPGLFISIASSIQYGIVLGWSTVSDAYVQRLNNMGNRMWGDSGVQLTNRPENVSSNDVEIISGGVGGGIVAWMEGGKAYAQRVDSSGRVCWIQNGILLSDPALSGGGIALCSDAKGGAIVNWNYSNSTGAAQRVNGDGRIIWQTGGVQLDSSGTGGAKRNSPDGKGGAFVGKGLNIHHIDSLGNKLWGSGVPYFDTLGTTNSSQVYDGIGGVYNFTQAFKNGEGFFIRAQWIDSTGKIQFGTKGIKVTPNLTIGSQMWPSATTDKKGRAIVCWEDYRSGYAAVYAGIIDTSERITLVRNETQLLPQSPFLEQNYPNPFNPTTRIGFIVHVAGFTSLKVYDILGRQVETLVNDIRQPGKYSMTFDSSKISSGVYFYRFISNGFVETKKMIVQK